MYFKLENGKNQVQIDRGEGLLGFPILVPLSTKLLPWAVCSSTFPLLSSIKAFFPQRFLYACFLCNIDED